MFCVFRCLMSGAALGVVFCFSLKSKIKDNEMGSVPWEYFVLFGVWLPTAPPVLTPNILSHHNQHGRHLFIYNCTGPVPVLQIYILDISNTWRPENFWQKKIFLVKEIKGELKVEMRFVCTVWETIHFLQSQTEPPHPINICH